MVGPPTQDLSRRTLSGSSCLVSKRDRNDYIHKAKYVVGVNAINSLEQTLYETELILEEYLTATAGQKFEPPISFEVVATPFFEELLEGTTNKTIDFLYVNPAIYSCLATEVGATALVTVSILPALHDLAHVPWNKPAMPPPVDGSPIIDHLTDKSQFPLCTHRQSVVL